MSDFLITSGSASSGNESPQLLQDLLLPGVDGPEVDEHIKHDLELSELIDLLDQPRARLHLCDFHDRVVTKILDDLVDLVGVWESLRVDGRDVVRLTEVVDHGFPVRR
jgi:hypothetical protein